MTSLVYKKFEERCKEINLRGKNKKKKENQGKEKIELKYLNYFLL